VGNLNFRTTPVALTEHLSAAGDIVDVYIATDRDTGRPRGFAFVTFAEESQATQAIRMFNGVEFDGRALNINEARERERRPPSRAPRAFAPQGPQNTERSYPRESFRDDFVPLKDSEIELDGASWGETRTHDWREEEYEGDGDGDGGDGDGGDDGNGDVSRGRRGPTGRKPKAKGSRRRLRARKREL